MNYLRKLSKCSAAPRYFKLAISTSTFLLHPNNNYYYINKKYTCNNKFD